MATKKKVAKKSGAKKAAKKKTTTKKTASKKTTSKKTTGKKKVAKKAVAKKTATKKSVTKKTTAKKKPVKKATAKKTTAKKAPVKKKAAAKKSSTKTESTANQNIDVQPLYGEPYKFKKGEEYMNPAQVEHFHNILNAWKADLMQEVDRTVHHMQDEAANFPDPNDRASQETEFALELRSRDRGRKLIKKIDESINMLKNDEYGYCEVCGVEIGVRRLEARPTANLCIDCKTLDEIKEKQMG